MQIISLADFKARSLAMPDSERFDISGDSGFKNLLATSICRSLEDNGPLSILITERGIWPNHQNAMAYDLLVDAYAINAVSFRSTDFGRYKYHWEDSSGLLFQGDSWELVACMFGLCLTNIWGVTLIDAEGTSVVEADHHEYLRLHADDAEHYAMWSEGMRKI